MEKEMIYNKEIDLLINRSHSKQPNKNQEKQHVVTGLKAAEKKHLQYQIDYQKNADNTMLSRFLAYRDQLKE